MPGFSQSDIYGFGFKLPYYRVLGPSADATVTPFVTTSGGVLLEGEYRRRFAAGGFDLWGVVTVTRASTATRAAARSSPTAPSASATVSSPTSTSSSPATTASCSSTTIPTPTG